MKRLKITLELNGQIELFFNRGEFCSDQWQRAPKPTGIKQGFKNTIEVDIPENLLAVIENLNWGNADLMITASVTKTMTRDTLMLKKEEQKK